MIRLINKLECCPAKHLAMAIPLPGSKISMNHYVPWETLPTRGLMSAETTDAVESVRMFTTKVTARLCQARPEWTEPMAFRLTTVSGRQFILGLSYRPYPVWLTKDTYSENPTDRSECQLSIEWKSVRPLMELLS